MKRTLWVAALVLLLLTPLRAADSAAGDDARECYEWFGELGYPAIKKAPWVKVWTGGYIGSVPPEPITTQGFLVGEKGDQFTILLPDLRTFTYTKTKPGVAEIQRVAYEKMSFPEAAKASLAEVRDPTASRSRDFGQRLALKSRLFFLSYACEQKGEPALAREFFEEARKARAQNFSESRSKEDESMRLTLEKEIAHAQTWQAVVAVGGGDWGAGELMPRRELLKTFRDIERRFPNNPHLERVKYSADMLERMVKEDAGHLAISDEELAKLPVDKQVAELIFRLRDQNGHQFSQPGWCDVFDEFSGEKTPSAADRLAKIGYPAVPQLIEALGDARFSRSVGFHRDFHFSHHILTIGDCAEQILERIAARSFYSPASTSSYMARDDEVAKTRQEVEKWWTDFQAKGEKETLVAAVSAAAENPTALVARLKEKYPEAVEGAVLAGAAQAKDDWMVGVYLELLGPLPSQAATNSLRTRLEDKSLMVRITAARYLWERGDAMAIPAVIKEWQALNPEAKDMRSEFEKMLKLLIASGESPAMEAVLADWDKRPVYQRFDVVSALGALAERNEQEEKYFSPWEPKPKTATPEARAAAEALLARALEDTDRRTGMSGNDGEFVFSSPRICDFALFKLNKIAPDTYAFSPKASTAVRDRERIVAANVWRKAHGQPELPVPVRNLPVLPADEALKITAIKIDPSLAGAEKFAEEVERLKGKSFGPETLPGLLKSFAAGSVPSAQGVEIEAWRDSDLRGVEIDVKLAAGNFPDKGYFSRGYGINVNSRGGESSSGTISVDGTRDETWEDFFNAISRALKEAKPETDFAFNVKLQRQN